MNRSSVVGWALTALGVFLAAFVAMWIVDASVPHAYNLTHPQIWLGAAILGALALAGIAWDRQAETKTVLQGVAAGALGAAVAIGALYLFAFANLGFGGYSPQLTASVPVNGTWDNRTALGAFQAQELDTRNTGWGAITGTGSPEGRFELYASASSNTGTNDSTPGTIDLRVSYGPQSWLESNEAAGAWIEENRDRIEQRFASFLDAFLAETGWEQAGDVTWRNSTAVG